MNDSNAMQLFNLHEEALREQVLVDLANEGSETAEVLDAEIVEAYYREDYFSSVECDQMLGALLLEGPEQYLETIKAELNERCDQLRTHLVALRDEPDQATVLMYLGEIAEARYYLLRLFLEGYPKPPFSVIRDVLPVKYRVLVFFRLKPEYSQIQGYLCDLILELPVIEEYLTKAAGELPLNPFLRFFARHRKESRRRRFFRAVEQVGIAAEGLRGFLNNYFEPYLLTLRFRQQYQEASSEALGNELNGR